MPLVSKLSHAGCAINIDLPDRDKTEEQDWRRQQPYEIVTEMLRNLYLFVMTYRVFPSYCSRDSETRTPCRQAALYHGMGKKAK